MLVRYHCPRHGRAARIGGKYLLYKMTKCQPSWSVWVPTWTLFYAGLGSKISTRTCAGLAGALKLHYAVTCTCLWWCIPKSACRCDSKNVPVRARRRRACVKLAPSNASSQASPLPLLACRHRVLMREKDRGERCPSARLAARCAEVKRRAALTLLKRRVALTFLLSSQRAGCSYRRAPLGWLPASLAGSGKPDRAPRAAPWAAPWCLPLPPCARWKVSNG